MILIQSFNYLFQLFVSIIFYGININQQMPAPRKSVCHTRSTKATCKSPCRWVDDACHPGDRKVLHPRKPGAHQAARARAAANPWLAHVKATRAANPGLSYKEALKVASDTYVKVLAPSRVAAVQVRQRSPARY